MEPIDTYGGEGGNGADDIVLLSHPNPTTPLHHVTLTAKPHAFAGAVLTPKHARELTPALVLSVVVSLAEQASSTKGGGAAAHGSASVTGSISGASAPAAGAHHGHTPSGASSTGGGGHGGVPPPPPSPSLPHSPPNLGRRPSSSSHVSAHTAGAAPGVANADAAFRTIQQTASTDSGFGGGFGGGTGGSVSGIGGGGMAAGGGAQVPLSPNAVAAKFCESKGFAWVVVVFECVY